MNHDTNANTMQIYQTLIFSKLNHLCVLNIYHNKETINN